MPFLSIVTRNHPRVPDLFGRCKASVEMQKDRDFQHLVLHDEEGRGLLYANRMLYENRHLVTGKYVFILDSDDVLTTDTFVGDMKRIAKEHKNPGIIFIRMLIGGELFPKDEVWEKDKMIRSKIGSSNFVVLNELWQKNIRHFGIERCGDFNFINTVFSKKSTVYWHDKIYSKTLIIGSLQSSPKKRAEQKTTDIDSLITAVTVTYNTRDIFQRAYESVRRFHPDMRIIIIDGSDPQNDCYKYVSGLADEKTRVFHANKNVGHGRGLAAAISYVETPYFITMDSDIEMVESPLEAMLGMMEDRTCVVGHAEEVDTGGFNYGKRKHVMNEGKFTYIHPYFSLYQLKEYKKYAPFCHHGAPAINIMFDINRKNMVDKALKIFPGLGHSGEFVRHDGRGTKAPIEGNWAPVLSPFSKKITCITPTGDRVDAFRLTKRWIESQTMQPNQWIVVDDGFEQLPKDLRHGVHYIRRKPKKNEGHTLNANISTAFPHIEGDIILIIEDDDWYGEKYIETMYNHLQSHDLVGEGHARYYHLPTRQYCRVGNVGHASLCQTGFTRKLLPHFEKSIEGDPYIDMRFWRRYAKGHGFLFHDVEDRLRIHCSMKGLLGRKGIGTGHNEQSNFYKPDPCHKMLERWIGKDNVRIYIDHLKGMTC